MAISLVRWASFSTWAAIWAADRPSSRIRAASPTSRARAKVTVRESTMWISPPSTMSRAIQADWQVPLSSVDRKIPTISSPWSAYIWNTSKKSSGFSWEVVGSSSLAVSRAKNSSLVMSTPSTKLSWPKNTRMGMTWTPSSAAIWAVRSLVPSVMMRTISDRSCSEPAAGRIL